MARRCTSAIPPRSVSPTSRSPTGAIRSHSAPATCRCSGRAGSRRRRSPWRASRRSCSRTVPATCSSPISATPRSPRSRRLRFLPAGDLAVSVELGEEISVEVNTRVRALEYLIDQKAVAGVVETVPTYRALLVYYDPSIVGYEALCAHLASLAEQATTTAMPPAREVELPCCYQGELGPDLEAAARRLELPADELVRLHAAAEDLGYFIGF